MLFYVCIFVFVASLVLYRPVLFSTHIGMLAHFPAPPSLFLLLLLLLHTQTYTSGLKADCVPETDRQVDPFAVAKLSRYILPDEMNLVKVVKLIVDNLGICVCLT